MSAQRRAAPEPTRRPDPILLALAALIRSAHDNRRARRATLMTIIAGNKEER